MFSNQKSFWSLQAAVVGAGRGVGSRPGPEPAGRPLPWRSLPSDVSQALGPHGHSRDPAAPSGVGSGLATLRPFKLVFQGAEVGFSVGGEVVCRAEGAGSHFW